MRRLLLLLCVWCDAAVFLMLLLLESATAFNLPTEIADLDKPISFTEVSGIAHGKVRLPCSLRSEYDDVAKLVLWYKEPSNDPIYGFDMRKGRQRDNATRWSSPKALGHRAYFSANDLKDVFLDVSELKPKDEGLYRCRVDFANSPTTNQKINLTVIELPSQPVILDGNTMKPVGEMEKSYNEGTDVKLICITRGGKPPPRLTWYLENNVIDNSYEYKPSIGQTVNHLVYERIQRHHYNAQFVCQANNIPPDSHFSVDPPVAILALIVNLKPLDVHILTKESRVLADKKYEVECRSSGSRPAAVITWWIANRRIDNQTKTYAPENNQSLSILSFVPNIEDNGKYLTCRAENPNITDSALEDKWHLDVQYQPMVSLKMGSSLNPDSIKEGDDVYFECLVRANPEAYKLSWFKDAKELKNNSTMGIVLSGGSLVLQGITRNSAGNYTCLAVNSEGKTISNPVPLRVMYAPVCKDGRSEVVVGALKQETVSLMCSVESHPAPETFHWTFNNSGDLIEVPHSRYSHTTIPTQQQAGTDLKEYQQFHGSRMNYTPSSEMDYGTVACWASNQVGRQRSPCLFQVIAAGRPYALHNCTATELSSALEFEELGLSKNSVNSPPTGTGLLVRCIEGYDGGLPIQSYHVEVVSDEDGPVMLNKSVPATPGGPMIEVAGLSTGRSYKLFLYAVNAKGRSEPTILEPVMLKGVAMYTTGNADASVLSPLLLGLAATATLLALAVAGILAALYRKHASGQVGSPKHAPIVCEPPNPGSTTPVHPQTKQPVDDIDPDIIPNEYERRPLTYTSVYKTPPQRRRIRERNGAASPVDEEPDKKDLQEEALLAEHSPAPTIRFAQNHHQQLPPQLPHHLIAQATSPSSLYGNSPTLADFKQMAFEAYNQRNNQNVYYSLQRPDKGILTMPQRPVTSSVSAHVKIHQPEVVTRSNRIQESCI
ncbi:protein turtle-like isoform X2 [Phymastichus coffea]|uniref:protein turtle-like isoform X2 n=1 Tax=Phymastichus coffea TaxID=108790 RepID=UPI00273BFB9F|nr:protein turtle-like isoform X2 [Phymastichus coffea]